MVGVHLQCSHHIPNLKFIGFTKVFKGFGDVSGSPIQIQYSFPSSQFQFQFQVTAYSMIHSWGGGSWKCWFPQVLARFSNNRHFPKVPSQWSRSGWGSGRSGLQEIHGFPMISNIFPEDSGVPSWRPSGACSSGVRGGTGNDRFCKGSWRFFE